MSVPALRQPKSVKVKKAENKKPPITIVPDLKDYLIVTLKNGKKLVVSSDSYHGILTAGEIYKCVFCAKEMILDVVFKEMHKNSPNHKKSIEKYPHVEDFKDNLVRTLAGSTHYCTICNVVVLSNYINQHIRAENHAIELEKAYNKAESYVPKRQPEQGFPPLKKK